MNTQLRYVKIAPVQHSSMSIFPEHPQMLAAEEFMVSVITLENAFLCPILVVGHLQSLIIILDSLSGLSLLSTNILQFIFIPKHHG